MHLKTPGFAAAFLAAVLTAGCGGGSNTPAVTRSGSAVVNVLWNASENRTVSRLIPLAANSIKITLKQSSTELDSAVMVRPASGPLVTTHTFDKLPLGAITADAQTFASQDGTGIALSSNVLSVTIVADTTV